MVIPRKQVRYWYKNVGEICRELNEAYQKQPVFFAKAVRLSR